MAEIGRLRVARRPVMRVGGEVGAHEEQRGAAEPERERHTALVGEHAERPARRHAAAPHLAHVPQQ